MTRSTSSNIRQVLEKSSLSQSQKAVIACWTFHDTPTNSSEIKQKLIRLGLQEAREWNVSRALANAKSKKLLSSTKNGCWVLTTTGRKYIDSLGLTTGSVHNTTAHNYLLQHIEGCQNDRVKDFMKEALNALNMRLYRSCVVLSWIGAVSMLHSIVVQSHLIDYNNESKRRNPKHKTINTIEQIRSIKESLFIEICEGIGLIDKSTKDNLLRCLTTRNGCGHPNNVIPSDAQIAAHLEILILHVYIPFSR